MECSSAFAPDDDELLVNYNDAVVYGRDWKLIAGCGWLNDACINYQLQRLQSKYNSKKTVLLLDPAVTSFLVHQADDEDRQDFIRDQLGPNIETVLIPINDSMMTTEQQNGTTKMWWQNPGTHWTLLHWSKQRKWIEHFDSAVSSGNRAAAETVARVLGWKDSAILTPSVPQQTNGYDCGVHVLITVEHILKGETVSGDLADIFRNGKRCHIARRNIAKDILEQSQLYQEQQKSTR